jgi:hypothetical protein
MAVGGTGMERSAPLADAVPVGEERKRPASWALPPAMVQQIYL